MRLTDGAASMLESYVTGVRSSLSGKPGVSPEDVVAGIREHVEAELSLRGQDRASVEDVAEVLERLGKPEDWIDGTPSDGSAGGVLTLLHRWPELAALACVGLGGVLVLAGVLWGVGWGLLGAGALLARFAVGTADEADPDRLRHLVLLVWWAGGVAGGVVVLVGPAVLVWVGSQTGGFLEPWLVDWMGTEARPRPVRYWTGVAGVTGMVSAVWWVLLGTVVSWSPGAFSRALGPLASAIPTHAGRALSLLGVGALVVTSSLLFVFLGGVLR